MTPHLGVLPPDHAHPAGFGVATPRCLHWNGESTPMLHDLEYAQAGLGGLQFPHLERVFGATRDVLEY